mgnify:FL=1
MLLKIIMFLTLKIVDFTMETEREMTERWIKETEYAVKNKIKTIIYIIILVVLASAFIWYSVKY